VSCTTQSRIIEVPGRGRACDHPVRAVHVSAQRHPEPAISNAGVMWGQSESSSGGSRHNVRSES
jgi:hypothetical protein